MRYTTNGVPPTSSYGVPIAGTSGTAQVTSGATLQAIAFKSGMSNSAVASGQYTTMGVVVKPVLNKGGYSGCSSAPNTVAMTTTTSGATIHWTVGATPPSKTYGNTYTGAISISPTTAGVTVRAMAFKSGMVDSGMALGYYELFPPQDCGGNQAEPPPEENETTTTPTYSSTGNLTTGFDGSTYSYDAANRLLSASKAGVTMNFYYDGLNRQIARTVNGAAVYSVYDGWNLVAEYAAGGLSKAWLYGPGGLVKELTQNYYYYQDGSGSTSHLADSAGQLLEWYRYDLQGKPVFSGDANATLSAYGVRHLYTGQQWYGELGLYDLRNRYYSPEIGRFLQPDPIGFAGDPSNLYRYCGNNPVNLSDPSGMDTYIGARSLMSDFPQPQWSNNYFTGHVFVFTTNANGSLAHSYGWGENGSGMFVGRWPGGMDSSLDKVAANALIQNGGASWQGDSKLDPFIQVAFNQLQSQHGHWNAWLTYNCRTEADKLVATAQFLQSRFAGFDSNGGYVYDAPAVSGFTADDQPIYVPTVWGSAGYDSPEAYAAAHQEAMLLYSYAQAAPTWEPFAQPDERTVNGLKPTARANGLTPKGW